MNNLSDYDRRVTTHRGWKSIFAGIGGGMDNHPDERVHATRQRWAARGMYLMTFLLNMDMLIRIWYLKQSSSQFLDIAIIWLAGIFFVSVGMYASGVQPFGGKWSKTLLILGVLVATDTVLFVALGVIHSLTDLFEAVAVQTAGALLLFVSMRGIYALWERRTLGSGSGQE